MDEGYKAGVALHHVIIRTLIDTGACPSNAELQTRAGIAETLVLDALRKLEEIHGVVLHPAECTPWVIHPFSLTPTSTYVEGKNHGWWAPCLWCGFGVATLAGGEVQIHTRLGGEARSVVINVKDGHPTDAEYCVHFAIPPRNAWNNVHAHCAMLLPFRNEQDARDWSTRHRLPFGEVVSLDTTAALARMWYRRHADRDWQKWTVAEAQSIFDSVGLRSTFWNLDQQSGRF
jgi:hypothetical protein